MRIGVVTTTSAPLSKSRIIERDFGSLKMWGFLIFLYIVFSGFFFVWSKTQITSLAYEISDESRKKNELFNENKELKLEIATLKSPERIEKIALLEMGLTLPAPSQIIEIR